MVEVTNNISVLGTIHQQCFKDIYKRGGKTYCQNTSPRVGRLGHDLEYPLCYDDMEYGGERITYSAIRLL